MTGGRLQIVVCGAGPAADVAQLITAAAQQSWTTAVTATPSSLDFIDVRTIEGLTGHPVRSTYRSAPGTRRTLPAADALVIAPATYNSANKIALSLADNYAMTTIAEMIGRQVPTVIVPFVNAPGRRTLVDTALVTDASSLVAVGAEAECVASPPAAGDVEQFDAADGGW